MTHIIGIDEVGTGAWAGPIFIGGVRAPINWIMPGLKDSKKLTRETRAELTQQLHQQRDQGIIDFTTSMSPNDEIDELGLGVVAKMCYTTAISRLYKDTDQVILDGNLNPKHLLKYGLNINMENMKSVIKADDKYPVVMAASIIAKYYRDELMITVGHGFNPEYGWDKNVGYIVPDHKDAVRKYGLSSMHRKSYNVKL
jgi:ribonuclease HII